LKKVILLLLTCLLAFPLQAFAYSYGDPTKEDIAETFKLIKGHLDASPPDWNSAAEAYKVRRSEISSHFGESITVTLDQNIKNEQKAEFIANYRYVLYINIDRRFTYARKDINDYSKAKLLIAKAKGTYDVLKPYVQSKIPKKVPKIEAAFDKALEALGNPGLFGVGEEPLDVEEYDKQTAFVLSALKPIFPYTKAEAPKEEDKPQEEKQTEEEKQPSSTSTNTEKSTVATSTKSDDTKTSKTSEETKTDTSEKEDEPKDTKNEAEMKEDDQAATKEAEPTDGREETETAANKAPPEEAEQKESTTNETDAAGDEPDKEADTELAAAGTSVAASAEASADHAPMERSTKTNPFITFAIIASVIILGAGGIFFAKKRNII
jgi:hypothetical protein